MSKTQFFFFLIATCTGMGFSSGTFAADIEAGRITATQCAVCHGSDGEGVGIPKSCIACIDAETFKKHLYDFKNGKRRNYMMEKFVANLSDNDIENLAAYYASKSQADLR